MTVKAEILQSRGQQVHKKPHIFASLGFGTRIFLFNFTKILRVHIQLCDTCSKGALDQKSFGFCKCFRTFSTTVAQHILGKEKFGTGRRGQLHNICLRSSYFVDDTMLLLMMTTIAFSRNRLNFVHYVL